MTIQAKQLPKVGIIDKVAPLHRSIRDMQATISDILFSEETVSKPAAAKKKAMARLDRQRAFNFAWVNTHITPAYMAAADIARKRCLELKLKAKGPNTAGRKSREIAIDVTLRRMNRAMDSVEEKINLFFRLLNKSKTALMQNLSFGEGIEKGIKKIKIRANTRADRATKTGHVYQATMTRVEVQREIQALFEQTFGDFAFIEIKTQSGRTINYKPDAYFKMLARTELRDVQTKSTFDIAEQFGCDLVMFSKHENPCDVCAELEGQVFSISGSDPDFEPVPDPANPHPNCEHNYNPVTRVYLREIGVL